MNSTNSLSEPQQHQSENLMHILWIKSDYIDPPNTGGKIRTYNLLRELTSRCQVTYISLRSDSEGENRGNTKNWASKIETFPFVEEEKNGWRFILRVMAAVFSTMPYIVRKYLSPEIQNCQLKLIGDSASSGSGDDGTILVCDFLEMAGNVDWSLPCPKVLFQHNVESTIWQRYFQTEQNLIKRAYFWFEHHRMRRFEKHACNRFDLVLAVSSQDRKVLQQMGVRTPIEIVETGVDTQFFAPPPNRKATPGRLLFLGSLDWMPNIDGIEWFISEIYPQIKQAFPHVSIDIVGRKPIPAIQVLTNEDDSIKVYGSVPDVRPYMEVADLFVVPLRVGSGTRLKIFEAMAMKLPVVSTTIGAEGLPVEHNRDLVLADSPKDFANTVISMLKSTDQKQQVAEQGYELVTQNYSWETVSTKLHETCSNLYQQSNV